MHSFFDDRSAKDEKKSDERAGYCKCGAKAVYVGGGKACSKTRKPIRPPEVNYAALEKVRRSGEGVQS